MIYFMVTFMEMSLGKRFEGEEGKRKFSLLMVATKKPKFSSVCITPRGGQKQLETKKLLLDFSYQIRHFGK